MQLLYFAFRPLLAHRVVSLHRTSSTAIEG